jgi:DNA polymerase-3 subunit epsilon
VIRDEVKAMSERIRELSTHATETQKTRWPLEDMLGADFVSAAARRIEARLECRAAAGDVDGELWLRLDSYSLLQALVHLAARLVDEYGVRLITLRLARAGARAQLDLVWSGPAMSTETVVGWETDPDHGRRRDTGADAARRRRAARRCVLVRARARAP